MRSWPPDSSDIARMLTCSLESRRQQAPPDCWAGGRKARFESCRTEYQNCPRPPAPAVSPQTDEPTPTTGDLRGDSVLREHLDHDTAILRAAGLGLVRRDRLLHAVADDVHLVQRNLILVVEIALHGFGALEADLLVGRLGADVVGVAFDLEIDVLRVLLHLRDHLVELGLRFIRQHRLAE